MKDTFVWNDDDTEKRRPGEKEYIMEFKISDDVNDTHWMAIFQDKLGKPVPEWLHSGFYWN